jgi:hypothetical protein
MHMCTQARGMVNPSDRHLSQQDRRVVRVRHRAACSHPGYCPPSVPPATSRKSVTRGYFQGRSGPHSPVQVGRAVCHSATAGRHCMGFEPDGRVRSEQFGPSSLFAAATVGPGRAVGSCLGGWLDKLHLSCGQALDLYTTVKE